MVSKTFSSQSAISLVDFGQDVARRRAAAGDVAIPRNTGMRRTESKRALLAAINEADGLW